jgi:hypothetical protein
MSRISLLYCALSVYSRLWLTIVAFLLMGVGLAPAFIPSYADLLKIAK